jgi:hypothetical protein
MVDLSLHILDIAQNSVRARATLIQIMIVEDLERDLYKIEIEDNGSGMDEQTLSDVTNPFYTTRTTRKVGLGIPLLKQNAEMCEGKLLMFSELGEGTKLKVYFRHSHIDRPPQGDIASTVKILIAGNPEIDFEYHHTINRDGFRLTTQELKQTLDGIPVNEPEVLAFIESMINDNIKALNET